MGLGQRAFLTAQATIPAGQTTTQQTFTFRTGRPGQIAPEVTKLAPVVLVESDEAARRIREDFPLEMPMLVRNSFPESLGQAFLKNRKIQVVQVATPLAEKKVRLAFPFQRPIFVREFEGESVIDGLGRGTLTDEERSIFDILLQIAGGGLGAVFIVRALKRETSPVWNAVGFAALSGAGLSFLQGLAKLVSFLSKEESDAV